MADFFDFIEPMHKRYQQQMEKALNFHNHSGQLVKKRDGGTDWEQYDSAEARSARDARDFMMRLVEMEHRWAQTALEAEIATHQARRDEKRR
ncbi:hypothetical protein PIS_038 [Saccharomonospora phage PIS 136]|nr:hypothetical protein PIS_038 [Saccharomonospora phage PIS 136]